MRKKLILFVTLIGLITSIKAQTQDFHAFKFDFGFGYALPSNGSGTQAGATFTLQPHYRFSDGFALGIRMEAAAIGYEYNSFGNYKVSALASTCLSGEIYLSKRGFRPFIGAGAGLFDQQTAYGSDNNTTISNRTINFGGYPEIGFEAGHLRISAEYNFTGASNNYAAAKLGFFFGGGRKRR